MNLLLWLYLVHKEDLEETDEEEGTFNINDFDVEKELKSFDIFIWVMFILSLIFFGGMLYIWFRFR